MSTKPATALLPGPRVRDSLAKPTRTSLEPSVKRNEINISGSGVLVGLAIGFLLTSGFIWALVKYWLFAP